jgi:phospholipase/carboxylesterase
MNATPDFIHKFIPGSSARTLLLLHGTGGSENDLLTLGRTLDPAAALLSPRGKVLENGMPRFFRRLAEGVFDEKDLIQRTHELADFIDAASEKYGFDQKELIAVGYSNGANIAASILLLRPGTLGGAALLRAMVPLEPESLPSLDGTPVLLVSGNYDPIVPVANAKRLAALLKEAGAKVTVSLEESGHGLTEESVQATKDWLHGVKL